MSRVIGSCGSMPVIATMYLRPWEGPAMIRLAYEARLAFDTLERAADALMREA